MIFDWSYAWSILPLLGQALKITVLATMLGMMLAITLGLLLALARRSPTRWVSWPTAFFIEFVRSTPLLVQLYFFFFIKLIRKIR